MELTNTNETHLDYQNKLRHTKNIYSEVSGIETKSLNETELFALAAKVSGLEITIREFVNGEYQIGFQNTPSKTGLQVLELGMRPIATDENSSIALKDLYSDLRHKISEVKLEEMLKKRKISPEKVHKLLEEEANKINNNPDVEKIRRHLNESRVGLDDLKNMVDIINKHNLKPNEKLQSIVNPEKLRKEKKNLRYKITQMFTNSFLILNQIITNGQGILPATKNNLIQTSVDKHLAMPDHDSARKIKGYEQFIKFAVFASENDYDPESISKYLSQKENINFATEYLLNDYFESLQYFPLADRERLTNKSIDFVSTLAGLYTKDGKNNEAIKSYLMEISKDKEMQDLFGYTFLPFVDYLSQNDEYAREQWLKNFKDDPVSISLKIMKYLYEYDPKNSFEFKQPEKIILPDGSLVTIPQEVIDELNALPPNPNYLPPDQFIRQAEAEYRKIVQSQTHQNEYIPPIYFKYDENANIFSDGNLNYFLDTLLYKSSQTDDLYSPVDELSLNDSSNWFTKATTGNYDSFGDIYQTIDDPDYLSKFGTPTENSDMNASFTIYFLKYIDYIKQNATLENKIDETKLYGYALARNNGNYTYASMDIALLYKLIARYDLTNGYLESATYLSERNSYNFYTGQFMNENLPVIQSVNYQQTKFQDINQVIDVIKTSVDSRLNDQFRNGMELKEGYSTGSNNFSIAEIVGIFYHYASQQSLIYSGIANPSAVGIYHAANEFPLGVDVGNFIFTTNENSGFKASTMAMAGMDDIARRKFIEENYKIVK